MMHRLICLVLALWLASCADSSDEVLRFGVPKAPTTLDPRFATDAISVRVNRLLYARLVDFDQRYQPVPSLADWQMVSPTRYVFTLNADRNLFSNGQMLNALDVVSTYEFVLDAQNASPHRNSLVNIQSVSVVSDDQVAFDLKVADPLFPGRLVIGIVPTSLSRSDHRFSRDPVGSGDFTFLDHTAEEGMRLRRRRDNQIIEFVRVPDPTVRALKLAKGEIDLLQGDIPWEVINWLDEREEVEVYATEGTNFSYIGFNLADQVLNDQRIRKAIAHAVNKQDFIDYIFKGAAREAGFVLDDEHWAGSKTVVLPEYNIEKARLLLAQAGYDADNPLEIEYKTSSDPFRVRLATILQAQLAQAGVKVKVRPHDWGTFYQDVKEGRFQMYTLAWVGIKLPDIFRYVFHSESIPPNGANRGRLIDARADRMIDHAEKGLTLDEQAIHYRALQDYLAAKLPYVPLWYESQVAVLNKRWRDYDVAKDGNFDGLKQVRRSQ